MLVGEWLAGKDALPAHIIPSDLATIVSTACLAHDIGNLSLIHISTDFQHTTFTQFDKINVSGEGSSATIYALTDSPALTKTGAGDLKLGADAAEAETILGGITEGISIMEGSLNLSGADGSHMKGTLNIAAGSRLTGVTGSVTVGEGGLDGLTIALGTENIGQDTQASDAVISLSLIHI